MTEEVQEQEPVVAVSEQPEVEPQDEQKMVPLAALQAERRKRQDLEARAQVYEELMRAKDKPEPEEVEDPNALVEKKHLHESNAHTKRDILETLYQDMNPKAIQDINKYLKPILEKKPWLAASVDTAQNRYARAYEIVQDYLHLVEDKPVVKQSSNQDGKRIIENSRKPGSPVDIGKSARPEGTEYLKSIQGKKEFRDYRAKVLRGEA
jgi:hypothetical protein